MKRWRNNVFHTNSLTQIIGRYKHRIREPGYGEWTAATPKRPNAWSGELNVSRVQKIVVHALTAGPSESSESFLKVLRVTRSYQYQSISQIQKQVLEVPKHCETWRIGEATCDLICPWSEKKWCNGTTTCQLLFMIFLSFLCGSNWAWQLSALRSKRKKLDASHTLEMTWLYYPIDSCQP